MDRSFQLKDAFQSLSATSSENMNAVDMQPDALTSIMEVQSEGPSPEKLAKTAASKESCDGMTQKSMCIKNDTSYTFTPTYNTTDLPKLFFFQQRSANDETRTSKATMIGESPVVLGSNEEHHSMEKLISRKFENLSNNVSDITNQLTNLKITTHTCTQYMKSVMSSMNMISEMLKANNETSMRSQWMVEPESVPATSRYLDERVPEPSLVVVDGKRYIGEGFWILDNAYYDILFMAGGGAITSDEWYTNMLALKLFGSNLIINAHLQGNSSISTTLVPPTSSLNAKLLSAVAEATKQFMLDEGFSRDERMKSLRNINVLLDDLGKYIQNEGRSKYGSIRSIELYKGPFDFHPRRAEDLL